MTDVGVRTIPHDVGAERAVLGVLLLSPIQALGIASEVGLTAEHFYREPHRLLWQIGQKIAKGQKDIDLVTMTAELELIGKLDDIGGYSYLAGLPASAPGTAHLESYIATVLDRWRRRQLLLMASETMEAVYGGEPTQDVIDSHGDALMALEANTERKGLRHAGDALQRVYEEIKARSERPQDVTGLRTGFRDLDYKLGGLSRTDLIVLAARPAMGKTALMLNIADHVAVREKEVVAVFSMEMSEEQIIQRSMASESRVLAHRLKTGRLQADDWTALIEATEALTEAPIFIDDRPARTVAGIRAGLRTLRHKYGRIGLVLVDYLQLMKGSGDEGNREQEVSSFSRGLKGIAKDFECPVVALSQLNRGVEQRADKRPLMSDLRESGAIEQDADQILFLYRDEVYNENTEIKGIAEVLVRKNRHGSIGDVKLVWRGEYLRFEDLARDEFV